MAYAFWDATEEARLIAESVAVDAAEHAHPSGESARLYRAKIDNGYAVDRTARTPGIDSEAVEFMPKKAWYKRFVYEKWNAELLAGLKAFGLENQPLKRFQHHDTSSTNTSPAVSASNRAGTKAKSSASRPTGTPSRSPIFCSRGSTRRTATSKSKVG